MKMLLSLALAAVLAGCAGTASTPGTTTPEPLLHETAGPTAVPTLPGLREAAKAADGWIVTVREVIDVEAQPDNPYPHVPGSHGWAVFVRLENGTPYQYRTGTGLDVIGSDSETYGGASVTVAYRDDPLTDIVLPHQIASGWAVYLLPNGVTPVQLAAKPGEAEVRIDLTQ